MGVGYKCHSLESDDMGMFRKRSQSTYEPPCPRTKTVYVDRNPNPNPRNYKILQHETVGDYLIVEIKYPDCTNYEGNKILLYRGITLKQLKAQGSIDPHFCNNPNFCSPIARFEPTDRGWQMAKNTAANNK